MKTRLLKKLRKQAKKRIIIVVSADGGYRVDYPNWVIDDGNARIAVRYWDWRYKPISDLQEIQRQLHYARNEYIMLCIKDMRKAELNRIVSKL
jgi:hypothetical protein